MLQFPKELHSSRKNSWSKGKIKPTVAKQSSCDLTETWSSDHRADSSLYKILCIDTIACSSTLLWDSWLCKWMGHWFLCSLFGIFNSSVVLSNSDMMVFILSDILLCYVCLLFLRCPFFSNERPKGIGSGWKVMGRNWEHTRGKLYSDYVGWEKDA